MREVVLLSRSYSQVFHLDKYRGQTTNGPIHSRLIQQAVLITQMPCSMLRALPLCLGAEAVSQLVQGAGILSLDLPPPAQVVAQVLQQLGLLLQLLVKHSQLLHQLRSHLWQTDRKTYTCYTDKGSFLSIHFVNFLHVIFTIYHNLEGLL